MAKKKTDPKPKHADQTEEPVRVDFETALMEIETIVRKLESGELTLNDSLRQYETAVGKMTQCYELLEIAERKISVLAGYDADGNPVTQPLHDAGDSQSDDAASLLHKQKTRGQRRGMSSSSEADADDDTEEETDDKNTDDENTAEEWA